MLFFPTGSDQAESVSFSQRNCRLFTLSEIELATKNFDDTLVIGSGGFGKVYKGTITCGSSLFDVAIKRLESTSNQGEVEFWAEVEMLSKLRHFHLVSLIGYCNHGKEMILVYDYMVHGNLADRLHKSRAPLTWVRRLKICIGAARGLHYLHTGTVNKPRVIHRDVKSSNILLDNNWAAKISDFGLSKIGSANQPSTYVNTQVKGTFGYIDPDYFQTGRLTRKSDVYAFGVILFEVLCGKQAVDKSLDEEQWGLVRWAQDSIKNGMLNQIVDCKLRGTISSKCLREFVQLADQCLHNHPKQRPTMAEVVVRLDAILALQEKTNRLPGDIKIFGRKVPAFLFPSNLVGGTSLRALDTYLYTVGGEDRILQRFGYNTIVDATENFSNTNKFWHVGYVLLFKGRLPNGQYIAIAQFYSESGYEECMKEASILVKGEHENLIHLIGYCVEKTNVYLIYDLVPYARLDHLIFDPMCTVLDWNTRYKIILGVARGLLYLHKHAPIRIIHGDVKPGNILLDGNFHPKLSYFGLATVISDTDDIHVDAPRGSLGYIAPEYLINSHLSTKADVFSFGVVVLEMITGQRTFDYKPEANKHFVHVEYVRRNWFEGTYSNIIDPKLGVDSGLMTKFIEIGLLCVQEDATYRPTMEEIVGMLLENTSLLLPLSRMRALMMTEPTDRIKRPISDSEMFIYQIHERDSAI